MAELKHKGCNGIVAVDIANKFTLRTHSLMITPTEFKLGVLELNIKNEGGNISFSCNTCDKNLNLEDDSDEIVAMCLVCSKYKSIKELYTSYPIPCICEDCRKEISGESKKKNKLTACFDVSLSDMVFIPILSVLKKSTN